MKGMEFKRYLEPGSFHSPFVHFGLRENVMEHHVSTLLVFETKLSMTAMLKQSQMDEVSYGLTCQNSVM